MTEVQPASGEWAFQRTLCYRLPVQRILLGVSGDNSSFSSAIRVWAIRDALFVPGPPAVTTSWSRRTGGGRAFTPSDFNGLRAAIEEAFSDLEAREDAMMEWIVTRGVQVPTNPRMVAAQGFAEVILGRVGAAVTTLDRVEMALQAQESGPSPRAVNVSLSLAARVRTVVALLESNLVDDAVQHLDRWSRERAEQLGLRISGQ